MFKKVNIDGDELKKLLAWFCMASRISVTVLMVSGCGTEASV